MPGDGANLKSRGVKVAKKGNEPPSSEKNEFEKLEAIRYGQQQPIFLGTLTIGTDSEWI